MRGIEAVKNRIMDDPADEHYVGRLLQKHAP
jgi:hypothetical protein